MTAVKRLTRWFDHHTLWACHAGPRYGARRR
jgi:hypothetical protein